VFEPTVKKHFNSLKSFRPIHTLLWRCLNQVCLCATDYFTKMLNGYNMPNIIVMLYVYQSSFVPSQARANTANTIW